MNRKHNPMLALAALVLLAMILLLTCTGCASTAGPETPEPMVPTETTSTDRFTVDYMNDGAQIITDTETGVQYLFYKFGYGAGLTQLLPGEG